MAVNHQNLIPDFATLSKMDTLGTDLVSGQGSGVRGQEFYTFCTFFTANS